MKSPLNLNKKMLEERPLLVKWIENFRQFSFNNDTYAALSFHVLIGQQLKHIKIQAAGRYFDPRISLFLLQPSGSGKSLGWDYTSQIATAIGLNAVSITEATDAALIGGQKEIKIQDENKTFSKYSPTKGILVDADIVHYDEASSLLIKSPYAQNALNYFQIALNPIGSPSSSIKKDLTHININFMPTCSLFFTTFMPEKIEEIALETGLLQRCLSYPRFLSQKMRKDNEQHNYDQLWSQPSKLNSADIIAFLKNLKQYDNREWSLSLRPDVKKMFLQMQDHAREELVTNAEAQIARKVETFLSRLPNHLITLALHSSFLRNDPFNIVFSDVLYADRLAFETLKHIVLWFESDLVIGGRGKIAREARYKSEIEKILQNPTNYSIKPSSKGIRREDALKALYNSIKITKPGASYYFDKYIEDSHKFWTKDVKGTKYFHPTKPNAKNFVWHNSKSKINEEVKE